MKRLVFVVLLVLSAASLNARSSSVQPVNRHPARTVRVAYDYDCPVYRYYTLNNGTCFAGYYEDCNGRIVGYFSFCT